MGGQEERYVGDWVNEGPVQLCPVLRVVITAKADWTACHKRTINLVPSL